MNKKKLIVAIILLIMSVAFTIVLTKVDVQAIGPENSSVGLATLNSKMTLDYNDKAYKISKYLGYVALLIPVVYAGIGFIQLVKGKSLKAVDKRLYMLAIFYVVVLATYLLFEKVVINYRPVILDEGLEASFPSSHTLMSICFSLSAIIINKSMFKDKTKLINVCLFLLAIAILTTRMVSGVHWFTDIIGSVLISCTLVSAFKAFIKK